MQCLDVDSNGAIHLANPQPADITTCTLVAGSYQEANATFNPVHPERAIQDSTALFLVGLAFLAVVWGAKQIYLIFHREPS